MGAQDMLDEAGPMDGKTESQGVFVQGRSRDGKFIQFDLEKDSRDVETDDVLVSIDIDSVIWVTDKPQFNGSINLHLLPLQGDKPPFKTNNHVYIRAFLPPTKFDRENHQRSSKLERYPLSSIPHTHFAYFSQGYGQFYIHVFFPRMIRKDVNTGFMATFIPYEVQDLWFSEVIIPAWGAVLRNDIGTDEYIPKSTEDLRQKMVGQRKVYIRPITDQNLPLMQKTMSSILADNPDLLSRFGSFFFVVDARGLKLLSKQNKGAADVYEDLCTKCPGLKWDYMSDRSNGELFLDLGISYHPPTEREPLVGLWRLDRVEESYNLMGTRKGIPHNTCTFVAYGGMQAEMKQRRSRLVQLCFRSTYNLCFEVVRTPNQTEYLCQDLDAIKVSDKFLAGCNSWKSLFRDAENRSYGVREEVRGSGLAIVKLLDVVYEKVCT